MLSAADVLYQGRTRIYVREGRTFDLSQEFNPARVLMTTNAKVSAHLIVRTRRLVLNVSDLCLIAILQRIYLQFRRTQWSWCKLYYTTNKHDSDTVKLKARISSQY